MRLDRRIALDSAIVADGLIDPQQPDSLNPLGSGSALNGRVPH
jgi:hypothetical protein